MKDSPDRASVVIFFQTPYFIGKENEIQKVKVIANLVTV